MKESGYYPMGAEHDKNAPWNEVSQPPIVIKCHVYETLKKNTTVDTEYYHKEDGAFVVDDNIDWEEEYTKQHTTIKELLLELKKYVEHDISLSSTGRERNRLRNLIEEIDGWTCNEIIVEEL